MSIRRRYRPKPSGQAGMSLIELIVAMVIISVGIGGILAVFSNALKGSADPMIRKQMLSIAEEMMDEISIKPYASAANTAASGCARNTFNDVSDFNGYATSQQICDIDGNPIAALAAYSVSITVSLDTTSFAAYSVTDTKKITVTVTNGSDSLSLVGWRANYAS